MRTGRKLVYSPSFLRSATLMLWWPPPIGVAVGPFKPDACHFQRSEHVVRYQLALFGERAQAGFLALPINRNSCGVNGSYGSVGDFGSDAVAGDKCDLVGHL